MEKVILNQFKISDDKKLLQLETVHFWLKNSYWATNIPFDLVQAGVNNSLCFGIYNQGEQVAFSRVISDYATFAYLADVVVDEKFRGLGLAKEMMKFILEHPQLQGLHRFMLATKDAHKLYEQFNFKVAESPENILEIKVKDIYLRNTRI